MIPEKGAASGGRLLEAWRRERERANVACSMDDGRNKVGRQPLFNLLEGRVRTHLDGLGVPVSRLLQTPE